MIETFVDGVDAVDGFPSLSEHKRLRIEGGEDAIVTAWGDGDTLVAVSVAAFHAGDLPHWALEVAVDHGVRTADLEQVAITEASATLPVGAPFSLWAQREDQRDAAARLGYEERRRVLRMEGPFPQRAQPSDLRLGTLVDVADADLIAVHNRAFAGHPEASGMTQERLDELREMPWHDPDGVVTAWVDERFAGYCWTKLHPNGDGEVYLLAVDPDAQGHRVGESLAAAGYERLQAKGARRAMLWVDGDNEPAIALYRRIGLNPTHANVEMAMRVSG